MGIQEMLMKRQIAFGCALSLFFINNLFAQWPPQQNRNLADDAENHTAPAVLYEEDRYNPQGRRYAGQANWHTEMVSHGLGLDSEPVVRADIVIPDLQISVTWKLRRNNDKDLPASHTIKINFNLPLIFPGGSIGNVPGIMMKQEEQAKGTPLNGLAVKVAQNSFLIGLSNTDVQYNVQLLKHQEWFDIPIVYANGARAILAVDKGFFGDRAFSEAFKNWESSASPSQQAQSSTQQSPMPQAQPPKLPQCPTLETSQRYFIAECIAHGMEITNHSDGLSDMEVTARREHDGLSDCAPNSLIQLQQMADVSSSRIVNSGVISRLMDFPDAMKLECSKAAASISNETASHGN